MKNKKEYYSVCLGRYIVSCLGGYCIGMLHAAGNYTPAIVLGVLTLSEVLLYAKAHVYEVGDNNNQN